MIKAVLIAIVGLALLFMGLFEGKRSQFNYMGEASASMGQPPTAISSEVATKAQWETTLASVGALEASQGVLLTADIAGRISAINFEAGAEVAQGALLVEQEVSSELTQLEAADADMNLAAANLKRVQRLYRQKLVSRSEFDAADAAYKSASARTETVKASLDKKQIVAPFAGKLGLRQVDLGQNISAGTPIVSLQAANPMLLNFSLPQHHLSQLSNGLDVRMQTDAVPDRTFNGKITAINSEINAITRAVDIQATFRNPDDVLLPGMFATVQVVLPEVADVLIVPVTAISYSSFGDSVFVIEEEKGENEDESQLVARQQFVQLGRARGDFVAVTKGLSDGDRVASAGVFKLRNGAPVSLNEDIKPTFELEPVLEDK